MEKGEKKREAVGEGGGEDERQRERGEGERVERAEKGGGVMRETGVKIRKRERETDRQTDR